MYFLIQVFASLLCVFMFFVKREHKFAIFLLASICLSGVVLSYVPFGGMRYILSMCFILSELPYIIRLQWLSGRRIIVFLLIMLLFSFTVLLINSPHYNVSIFQSIRLFILEIIGKYFALLYAFVAITREINLKYSLKITYLGLIVLTFFGVINLITRHASFVDVIGIGLDDYLINDELGGRFESQERFRVQAMFLNPFDYGFTCILVLYFQVWGYIKDMISKRQLLISIICCVFGVIACGCRTNMLCIFVGFFPFMMMKYKIKKQISLFLIACCALIVLYLIVPFIHDVGDNILSMFSSDSSVEGSSIEMRLLQYGTAFYYVKDNILFGRGYGFFLIDMGWGDGGLSAVADSDLWGLEGVLMNYMLERGVFGIAFYLLFYGIMLWFLFKNRNADIDTACLGVSVIILYMTFSNITGDLLSVFPSLLIIGACLKLIYSKLDMQCSSC